MPYGVFWGCVIPRRLPHIEASIRLVLSDLSIDYVDIKGAMCCPDPLFGKMLDPYDILTMSAYNLCAAQMQNLDKIISPCNGCYYSLSKAARRMKDENSLLQINKKLIPLGMEYKGKIEVVHLIDILLSNIKKIKEKIKMPLTGLKIASHHGCKMLGEEAISNVEDMVNPTLIDRVVETLGATPTDYAHKNTCCGGALRGYPKALLIDIVQNKLLSAKKSGADCVTTLCPLCYLYLEGQQLIIKRERNIDLNLPILSLSELIALSFGHTGQSFGLGYHMIPAMLK